MSVQGPTPPTKPTPPTPPTMNGAKPGSDGERTMPAEKAPQHTEKTTTPLNEKADAKPSEKPATAKSTTAEQTVKQTPLALPQTEAATKTEAVIEPPPAKQTGGSIAVFSGLLLVAALASIAVLWWRNRKRRQPAATELVKTAEPLEKPAPADAAIELIASMQQKKAVACKKEPSRPDAAPLKQDESGETKRTSTFDFRV